MNKSLLNDYKDRITSLTYGRWHDEQHLGDGFDEGVLSGMDLGDTEIHSWG